MSRLTNLHDIVQNIDERVTILEVDRHASFFITHIGGLHTFETPGTRFIRQGHQDGVLLQLGVLWSRKKGALLGSP